MDHRPTKNPTAKFTRAAQTLQIVMTGCVLALLGQFAELRGQDKKVDYPPITPNLAFLQQSLAGLDGPGWGIAYSPDMEMVIASCDRGTLQSWRKDVLLGIRAGSGSANVFKGHTGPVVALAWNGGPKIASAGSDKKILIRTINDGKTINTLSTESTIRDLAMSADGKLLAAATEDPVVVVWDVESGNAKNKLAGHKDWVLAVAFSPDGKQLASGSIDGTVILWDAGSGNKIREIDIKPKAKDKEPQESIAAYAITYSPDSKFLTVGDSKGEVKFIQADNGNITKTVTGHQAAVTEVAFHPKGDLIASASKDGTVRLWSFPAGGAVKTLEGHKSWVEGVAFIDQGTQLATVSADQTVKLWGLKK